MSILTSLFQPQAALTSEDIRALISGGGYDSNGLSITPETAMRQAAVYGCVKVLAEDVGQLPLILYKRTNKAGREGRERATNHPLYNLLKLKPNGFMTSFNFREMMTAHTAMRGNGLSEIIRIGNVVKALIPIHPDKAEIKCSDSWDITYKVTHADFFPLHALFE